MKPGRRNNFVADGLLDIFCAVSLKTRVIKNGFSVAAVTAFASLTALSSLTARADDFQFTVERKKVDAVNAKPTSEGSAANRSETWHYQVSLRNTGFKPQPALQAKYIVFVERQQLGKKVGTETLDRVTGTADLPATPTGGTAQFSTKDVVLKESGLVGDFIYANGGRIHAKDAIHGVWIKLFDGTKEVGQYINPTTLATKQKF